MSDWLRRQCTVFEGPRRLISGELAQVVLKTKEVYDRARRAPVLIFDNVTSEQIDVDYSGSPEEVLDRLRVEVRRGSFDGSNNGSNRGATAGPRTTQTGSRRPRGHIVAASLGMAEQSAWRIVRRASQARGRGQARQPG